MKEYIGLAMEFINNADELKPVVEKVSKALQSFGPEIYELCNRTVLGYVDLRIAAVKRFEDAGFTREEAIYMTMDEWWGLRKLSNKKMP